MAYKRPLSLSQSICIIILWLLFFILFCAYGKPSPFAWFMVLASAFVVFYPIRKSFLERKIKEEQGSKSNKFPK